MTCTHSSATSLGNVVVRRSYATQYLESRADQLNEVVKSTGESGILADSFLDRSLPQSTRSSSILILTKRQRTQGF